MNVVNFNERACERYRRYFDAYLDNELLVETNQDVLQHLNSCPECARILEARSRTKQLVRDAVTKEQAPPELVAALRNRLRTERPSFFAYNTVRWMMAAAAVLLVAIVGVGSLQWARIVQFGGDERVVPTLSARVQELLRVGLIDHLHCTIDLQRWKQFVSFDEMKASTGRQALGPEFIDLVPAVEAKLGSEYHLVQGHRCVADHRRYVHLILTGKKGAILSLVITEKNNESFSQSDAVAVMKASGIPIYRDRQGALEVAGFESDKYLAYVVSNLDRATNLNVASLMAPVVYNHLHKLEL
jgi:anti-sigma factor (TIGR02949 family)